MTTIEKDFEDLKARFEAFEERLKKPEDKPWPQDGDTVFIINPCDTEGYFQTTHRPDWYGGHHCRALATGMAYPTEEAARKRVAHDRLLTEVNGANDFVADYEDAKQVKHCIEIDSDGFFDIFSRTFSKTGSRIKPYPTREAAQAVIDKYGDDLKLLFEVV